MTADVREEAPGHRIDPHGHCRCGWERGEAAFHWSGDLPAIGATPRSAPARPPRG